MIRFHSFALLFSLLLAFASPAAADTVKDREGAVREDRSKMENDERWIYNDVERGFAEAKASGKPLLVTLRCVPCLSCMGMDTAVLTNSELEPLLDQFVCVRLINANSIDLQLFQFDYDLSFSTLIFNADRTIYGRYGSWQHQKDSQDTSLGTYRTALKSALELHRAYPANKTALASKQGGPAPFKTPVDIPQMAERYGRELDWQGNVVKSCVHCHQIGDAFRAHYRNADKPVPASLIYPMPAPETVGMTLSANDSLRIEEVFADSAAARAGLKPGDVIESFNGQPLISIADAAWVLHLSPEEGALPVQVKRDGQSATLSLPLEKDWRLKTDISRRVGTWSMRGMAGGGLFLEDLDDAARAERGLGTDGMALFAKGVGQYGVHGTAKRAGFQKEDVIVEMDGMTRRMSEGELLGALMMDPRGRHAVSATVLRNGKRISLTLPVITAKD